MLNRFLAGSKSYGEYDDKDVGVPDYLPQNGGGTAGSGWNAFILLLGVELIIIRLPGN
jgi:hypothetical protein